MGQPSSKDEMTIRHQFDRLCQMALKGEAVNYYKHMDYRRKHEVTFSELSEKELSKLFTMDEYGTEYHHFEVHGYDIEVHIIKAASEGDVSAINAVLKHYEGYIIKLSTRKLYDESGQVHYCIDETLRRRLETKLITKILAFEVA